MNSELTNFFQSSSCKDCFYYKKGVCHNLDSPLSYEDVNNNNKCEEWNEKKK